MGDIKGKKVLCLAGAGGLQAPLLACAGAEVTVLDISNKMLDKDREIAKKEKLQIEIVKGNMCDLSMFNDCQFDYIINPPSLMYVPELSIVFKEDVINRIIKKIMIMLTFFRLRVVEKNKHQMNFYNGVEDKIDMDVFKGNYEELEKMLIKE